MPCSVPKIVQGCRSSGNFDRYSVTVDNQLHLCRTTVLASVGISVCWNLQLVDFPRLFSDCFSDDNFCSCINSEDDLCISG